MRKFAQDNRRIGSATLPEVMLIIAMVSLLLPLCVSAADGYPSGSNPPPTMPGPIDRRIVERIDAGTIAYEKGRYDDAIMNFETALNVARERPMQARPLAEVLRKLGRALEDGARIQGATVAYDVALRALSGLSCASGRGTIET